jgi:nitrogen regulatory protein PII
MTMEKSHILLNEIEGKMQLKKVGVGLSFTVPLSSIDGLKSLNKIVKGVDVEKEDVGYMPNTDNELIVIIANRGYTDNVMEVARKAGAEGGTVVHARGTGQEASEKFFGTLIGAEKEMIFIVSKTEKRNAIMKEIKEKAGSGTPSEAISFSLPINEVAGFLEN